MSVTTPVSSTIRRARRRLCVAIVAGLALATVLPLTSAQAQRAGSPVITRPLDGSVQAIGFGGPVTVDFADAAAGAYQVRVFSPETDYTWTSDSWDYTVDGQTTKKFYPQSVNAQGHYKAVVLDDAGDWLAVSHFKVARPLHIRDVSLSPSTFYPIVRDGYLDATRLRYRLNQAATVTALVRDTAGHVVRRADVGRRGSGSHVWLWNGRKNSGRVAPAGGYTIEVHGKSDLGQSASAARRVLSTTKEVVRSRSVSRTGINTTTASRSNGCHVSRDTYYHSSTFDCWGGSFAQGTYSFRLPASAFNVRWSVRGVQHCCEEGVIIRRGERLSATRFRVLVKVTNWRAYEVRRAAVSFSYKKRI